MFRLLIVLGIVLPAAFGQLAVQQCAGLRPLPLSVTVPGCSALPCNIQSGGLAEVDITFTAGYPATYFNPSIFVDLGNDDRHYLELPEELQNGCNQLVVGQCPLLAGDTVVYQLVVPFDTDLPTGSVTIQFILYDDSENTLACFRGQINIV